MSTWNAYIVPLDDGPCVGKGPVLVTRLHELGIIDGFEDEELGWYTGGQGKAYPNVMFDYVEVYDAPDAYHFIPSATTGGYGATCPACGADVEGELRGDADDGEWPESHEKRDMSGIVVPCRSCGARPLLKDVRFEIPTAMTRFFVMLADASPSEWEPEFLQEVERVLGCKTGIVMERM